MKKISTDALHAFTLPNYQEIPDFGLYLDQVAKYINSFLTCFPEMNVTTSMISNYAKQKLIDRVNKKTYAREQIAVLILIVLFKNVISIDNIRTLLAQYEDHAFMYADFQKTLMNTCHDNPSLANTDSVLYHIAVALSKKMYLELFFETDKH